MKRKLFLYFGISLLSLTSLNTFGTTQNAHDNKVRAAAGDTHSMIFKGDYRGVGNYALSSAGWWGEGFTFNNEVATITNGSTAYFSSDDCAIGDTIIISYDLKTNGSTGWQFNVNTPKWQNLQNVSNTNNQDYVHYDFVYNVTSLELGSLLSFYFQITGTNEIYVKNLYVYNTTSVSVVEGQAISNLPSIAAVEGKRGYWAIDGNEIKDGDIYNYSNDKVVSLLYEELYAVTYYNGGAIDLASDTKYWNSGTNLVKEGDVLHMENDDGLTDQAHHNYDVSDLLITTVEKGKKYKLSFDIKCDNLYLRVANCSPWTMIVDGWVNYSEFTTIEKEFKVDSNGTSTIRFRVDTKGNAYIKNLRLYEVETVECTKGQALGTLPTIKTYGKFSEGVWQIDGENITSETIFNYEDYNKQAYVKYSEKYSLMYYGSDDIYTTNLAQNIDCWSKQGNANLLKSYDEDALVFKGDQGAMVRYCEPDQFKLIENETYIVKGKIKTGASKVHLVVNNDWANTILLTHFQAVDYQDINLKFVAPKNVTADSFIDFQISVADGEKQFSIKDFYIMHIKEINYSAGDTLADLPNAPTGSGWVIDDTLLTNTTTYDFADDKTAYLAPIISYNGEETITYRLGKKLSIEGLSTKSFYPGNNSYQYTWYDSNNQAVNELNEPGNYILGVKAIDVNGTKSLNEIKLNVTVLERDSVKPNWTRDGNTYIYPDSINMTVHAGWYAQFNIEALDDVDGIVEVTYDYNGLVDEFNRFVVGEGVVTCVAKDETGNEIQITINLVVVE